MSLNVIRCSVIKQQKFSYDVYKAFLKYLYTDEIDLPLENMLGMYFIIFSLRLYNMVWKLLLVFGDKNFWN